MKHLFLDLEDTVITPVVNGWHNSVLINVDNTKQVIEQFEPDFVHLFSFALHNQREVDNFNQFTRKELERELGIKLSLTPNMDEHIIPNIAKTLGFHPERVDFNDIVMLGKQIGFKLFVQHMFANTAKHNDEFTEVVLMDDTVFNETWVWPDLKISGRMIHVK